MPSSTSTAMDCKVGDFVCFRGKDCEVVQVAAAYRECYGVEPARCALKSVFDGGEVEWTDIIEFAQASQRGACKVYARRIVARAAQKETMGECFQLLQKPLDSLKDSQMVKTIFERSEREGWSDQRFCDEVSELCQLVAPGRRTLGALRPGAEPAPAVTPPGTSAGDRRRRRYDRFSVKTTIVALRRKSSHH